MENKIAAVSFYKPRIEDLWFRQAMLADPDTMSYNAAWGGTIPFPREDWQDWYDAWTGDPGVRFYRYIATGTSRSFVGEAAWHYDDELGLYLADVIISARCRRQGFGTAGLQLLCEAAKENGVSVLYDDIAADNPSWKLFVKNGFEIDYRTDDVVMVKKVL